jgi:hypothetical protein
MSPTDADKRKPQPREVGWGTAPAKLRAKSFTLDGEAVVFRGTLWGAVHRLERMGGLRRYDDDHS